MSVKPISKWTSTLKSWCLLHPVNENMHRVTRKVVL